MGGRTVQIATAEGTEHENTTTEGSIARYQFAANELQVGKIYEFSAAIILNDENSSDTNLIGVRFGTSSTVTSNTSCGASAAVDGVDADFAVVHGFLAVHSDTRAVCYGMLSASDAANVEKMCAFSKVLTIDRTVVNYLDITADFSVAHADNEIAAAHFHVRELT